MPPVPQTCTSRSSGKLATARAIARPSSKHRRPDGAGYCTTLTASGMTGHGHASGWPHIIDSGTVSPWSTSMRLTRVRSKSSWITRSAMCPASFGWPSTVGTGRGPQPSSAGAYDGPTPSAKVGMRSRLNAVAWSL